MTAPGPRDGIDPRAVEAAAEAGHRAYAEGGSVDEVALAAVWAAAPFLRAEGAAAERQRIAAEIDALPYPDTLEGRFVVDWQEGFDYAQSAAGRIAEAGPT